MARILTWMGVIVASVTALFALIGYCTAESGEGISALTPLGNTIVSAGFGLITGAGAAAVVGLALYCRPQRKA